MWVSQRVETSPYNENIRISESLIPTNCSTILVDSAKMRNLQTYITIRKLDFEVYRIRSTFCKYEPSLKFNALSLVVYRRSS